jgi:hypothetical protein
MTEPKVPVQPPAPTHKGPPTGSSPDTGGTKVVGYEVTSKGWTPLYGRRSISAEAGSQGGDRAPVNDSG